MNSSPQPPWIRDEAPPPSLWPAIEQRARTQQLQRRRPPWRLQSFWSRRLAAAALGFAAFCGGSLLVHTWRSPAPVIWTHGLAHLQAELPGIWNPDPKEPIKPGPDPETQLVFAVRQLTETSR
jgi:anti-sigma-K factor RskA